MFTLIKELFSILDANQRYRFYRLQILVIFMAVAEVVSVAVIGPFMLLLVNIDQIQSIEKLSYLYELTQAKSPTQFVFYASAATITVLFVTSCISIVTVWHLSNFSARTGAELSNRLFKYYLSKDWLFHSANDSASLSNKMTTETTRVTSLILQPLMNLNAKIILALSIGLGLFLMEPMVALAGISLFFVTYLLIFITIKKKLADNSRGISKSFQGRFIKQMEGLGGIRDILLLNRAQTVTEQFEQHCIQAAKGTGQNTSISASPRYFMEFVAIGAVILLVVYLTIKHQGNLGNILPLLAIYGLAGLKLLPAFQQSYQSIATIKGAVASFNAIKDDLQQELPTKKQQIAHESIELNRQIELQNINFAYPQKNTNVIDHLSLKIRKNQSVAFVGSSGSGKSTLADIISGLLTPQSGKILIDDTLLTPQTKKSWQNKIGVVSQNIYLTDTTIRENIAFGLPENEIDDAKVQSALKMAHLENFIESLDEGILTRVGERGTKLSGGQKQRIGIARALYNDPEILIFDEATSALDGITEKIIMKTINELNGQKTIITIAHRLSTIRQCDTIYLMERGKIVDKGNYEKLIKKNAQFSAMASASYNKKKGVLPHELHAVS